MTNDHPPCRLTTRSRMAKHNPPRGGRTVRRSPSSAQGECASRSPPSTGLFGAEVPRKCQRKKSCRCAHGAPTVKFRTFKDLFLQPPFCLVDRGAPSRTRTCDRWIRSPRTPRADDQPKVRRSQPIHYSDQRAFLTIKPVALLANRPPPGQGPRSRPVGSTSRPLSR